MSAKERRKSQRIEADLPICISGDPEAAEGKTINISSNGVFFESPRLIEPLTKVRMELMVPVLDGGQEKEMGVSFDGIVVRANPEKTDQAVSRYKIAVFFTHVPAASQKILDTFIKRRLSG